MLHYTVNTVKAKQMEKKTQKIWNVRLNEVDMNYNRWNFSKNNTRQLNKFWNTYQKEKIHIWIIISISTMQIADIDGKW